MYNKLFTKILDSSIWLEPTPVRIVWVTFLAMMDQDGTVALSGIGNVANRARVTEEEATEAINVLESPDARNPGQDNDGRRIERIPGVGWMVLNSKKYRDIIKAETARMQTRERVRKHRGNAVTKCNENVTPSVSEAVSISESKAHAGGEEKRQHEAPTPPDFSLSLDNREGNRKRLKKALMENGMASDKDSIDEWIVLLEKKAECHSVEECESCIRIIVKIGKSQGITLRYSRAYDELADEWKRNKMEPWKSWRTNKSSKEAL